MRCTSKWTFSRYLSFKLLMRPVAAMASFLSAVATETLRKRSSLSLPLIWVCSVSGSVKPFSAGAKVRAMSFSTTLPLIVEVENCNGRRSFLLGNWMLAAAMERTVLGSLTETSLRRACRLLAWTFSSSSLTTRPALRSSAVPLVTCATSVSLPNVSMWMSRLAVTSKWPASKAPRLGLPTFFRGL